MSEPPSPPAGSRGLRPALLLWLGGSALLLVWPLLGWLESPASSRLSTPASPVDRTMARYAEEWLFLRRARDWVPKGATVTVRAAESHREVSLFMLSLGLLPESRPLPARYFDAPAEQEKRPAEFILSFRCVPPGDDGLRRVAVLEEGCVFRRAGGP